MESQINPANIFLPVLVIVAITLAGFIMLSLRRGRAAKQRSDTGYYRAFLGAPEPEFAVVASRHYANLFEVPTLFYAACIMAFVLQSVTFWTLLWAWAYAAVRAIQSAVHLTYNNPTHRGLPFVVGWLFIVALWANVGLVVVARLG